MTLYFGCVAVTPFATYAKRCFGWYIITSPRSSPYNAQLDWNQTAEITQAHINVFVFKNRYRVKFQKYKKGRKFRMSFERIYNKPHHVCLSSRLWLRPRPTGNIKILNTNSGLPEYFGMQPTNINVRDPRIVWTIRICSSHDGHWMAPKEVRNTARLSLPLRQHIPLTIKSPQGIHHPL